MVINTNLSEQNGRTERVTTIDPWLSVEQIAEHLGVSKETIYRWVDRKKIPSHRVGKQWRFQASEVDEWVRRGEASGESSDNESNAEP